MITSNLARKAILVFYLLIYLAIGIYTESILIERYSIPEHFLQDQRHYNRGVNAALAHKDPYAIRDETLGTGYLYPPQALLIIELFSHIEPFFLRVAIFFAVNIALLGWMVYGVARYYGYSIENVWYWFVLCLGFAPFLELLHIGQINMIPLFGIFMIFFWEATFPVLSGVGLSLGVITKVTPLLYLGYLVVNRRYKVIVAGLVAIVLLSLLSVLRYSVSPLFTYPDMFQWLLQQSQLNPNSQTLAAKLAVADYPEFQSLLANLPEFLSRPLGVVVSTLTTEYRIVQRAYTLYILLIFLASALLTWRGKQPKEPLFIITGLGMMLAPSILWYHHYVFMLLPLLVWMGWRHLDASIVVWCCIGLLIVQIDRRFPPYGLLIHLFSNISMWIVLFWQIRQFYPKKIDVELATVPE
jgi:hypothetical protein